MILGVPKETAPGECRVALVPDLVPSLRQAGLDVMLQAGAGAAAGFLDPSYLEKGASLGPDAFEGADIVLKVRSPTIDEISRMKEGATFIGFLQPYANAATIRALAARKVTGFSMELYYNPKCMMLFGDAKESLNKLFVALKS